MYNYFLVCVLCLFSLFFYRRDKVCFLLSVFFIYNHILMILSVAYIENTNAYISEQRVWGSDIGSTERLFFIEICFFMLLYFFSYLLNRKNVKPNFILLPSKQFDSISSLYILICYMLVVVWCFSFLSYGMPILKGIPRSSYLLDNQYIAKIRVMIFILSGVLGFIYVATNSKVKKKLILGLLFSFLVLLLGSSDKFSGPINVLLSFFIFKYVTHYLRGEYINLSKKVFYLIPIAALMIAFVIYVYMTLEGLTLDDAITKILDRALVLQGHVWFGVDSLDFSNSLNYGLDGVVGDPNGLYYLMYLIADHNLVEKLQENLISFTMGFPAILLTVDGYYISFIFIVFSAFSVSLVFKIIIYLIKRNRIVGLTLIVFVYKFTQNAFNMGNLLELLYSKQAIFIYFCLIMYSLLYTVGSLNRSHIK